MSSLLGPAPAGVNVWEYYSLLLHGILYRTPAPYFALRSYILMGLIAFSMILAATYLVVLYLDGKRPLQPKTMWAFRIARKQAEGGYIITNAKFHAAAWTLVTGGVMLGAVWNANEVLVHQSSAAATSGWRTFANLPLLIQGWLMTWGSLQAFILTTTQNERRYFGVRLTNGAFVGGGVFLLVIFLASSIVNVYAGDRVWNSYVAIQNELATLAPTWSATLTATELLPGYLALQPFLKEVSAASDMGRITNIVNFAVCFVIPLLIAAVNVGSIALAGLVRKQLVFHIAQATGTIATSAAGVSTSGSGLGISSMQGAVPTVITFNNNTFSSSSNGAHASDPRKNSLDSGSTKVDHNANPLGLGKKTHMNRHALKSLVTRRGSGAEAERARHIQSLQKAEADLRVVSGFVFVWLLGITAVAVFTWVEYFNLQLATGPWVVYEICLFGQYWVYAVSLSVGLAALLYNAYQARHLDLTPPLPEFVAGGGGLRPLAMSGLSHQISMGPAPPAVPEKSFGAYSIQHDWEKEKEGEEGVDPKSAPPALVRRTTLTFAEEKRP